MWMSRDTALLVVYFIAVPCNHCSDVSCVACKYMTKRVTGTVHLAIHHSHTCTNRKVHISCSVNYAITNTYSNTTYRLRTYIYTHRYTHTCTHVQAHMHMNKHTQAHTRTHKHIHVHTHTTRAHTYLHMHTHTSPQQCIPLAT